MTLSRRGLKWVAPRVVMGLAGLLLGAELYLGATNKYGTLIHIGHDYALYMEATRSWLAGGPFCHPYPVIGIALVAWLGDPGYRGAAGGEEPETERGRWRMRRRLGGLLSPERRVLPTDGTFGGSAESTARGHN